ncbi:MAG: hypothetical protein HC930_00515 [Hydrococcus sp. SU_1_0]|nr:hypothetical protein [Hydrococcus sp. SU_1_0]
MMAKNNPSLVDLSRMRREARSAKREDLVTFAHEPSPQEVVPEIYGQAAPSPNPSVEVTRQEDRQKNEATTAKKPSVEEANNIGVEEQNSSRQSDFKSKISNDSKLKVVSVQTLSESEEQKKSW